MDNKQSLATTNQSQDSQNKMYIFFHFFFHSGMRSKHTNRGSLRLALFSCILQEYAVLLIIYVFGQRIIKIHRASRPQIF